MEILTDVKATGGDVKATIDPEESEAGKPKTEKKWMVRKSNRGSGEHQANKEQEDNALKLITLLTSLVNSRRHPLNAPDVPKFYTGSSELVINQPILSPAGYGYHLILPLGFRIDVGSNGCFRVYNSRFRSAVGFNPNEKSAGLITPWGRMIEEEKLGMSQLVVGKRLGRVTQERVAFSAFGRSLAFCVDGSGCKTTNEKFRNLDTSDFTSEMLVSNAISGRRGQKIAMKDLAAVERFSNPEVGVTSGWILSGYKVILMDSGELDVRNFHYRFSATFCPDGQVKVKHNNISMIVRDNYASLVRFNPKALESPPKTASVCASSSGNLASDVEKNVDACIKIDERRLNARFGGQFAGLNDKNELTL